MEIDFKKLSSVFIILVVFVVLGYLFYILEDQDRIMRIQGYMIRNQNIELEEKENILEQEKILNEDKDGDGLSLREEKMLKTSDMNDDSDGDTIPDKYDKHPIGGDRMVVKYFEWSYSGKDWDLELSIPSDVVTYYEQVPRPRWKGNYSYYSEFVDFNGIDRITKALKDFIDEYGDNWDYYDRVMFVVSMVRQIHYTSDILVGFDQFTKFPMQTLNDGTGDCEDMAILAAAILKEMDYDVKLVFIEVLNGMNHVAIAVFGEDYPGTYFERDGKKYYYIETITTGYGFGEYPSMWTGGNVVLIDLKE